MQGRHTLKALPIAWVLLAFSSCSADETSRHAQFEEAVRLRNVILANMERAVDDPRLWEAAAADLERVRELLPGNAFAPVNLAICYFRMGRSEAALEQLQIARLIAPGHPSLLFARCNILAYHRKETALEQALQEFREAAPSDPRPDFLAARYYQDQERWQEAVVALDAAISLAPENLALSVQQLNAAARARDRDAVDLAYRTVLDRLEELPQQSRNMEQKFVQALEAGDDSLWVFAISLANTLRAHELYALGLYALRGVGLDNGPMFPLLEFIPPLPKSAQGGTDIAFRLVPVELPAEITATNLLVQSRELNEELIAVGADQGLIVSHGSDGLEITEFPLQAAGASQVRCRDLNQDFLQDLLVVHPTHVSLYLQQADGSFAAPQKLLQDLESCRGAMPFDLDQDGDLDLIVFEAPGSKFLQNNADGHWQLNDLYALESLDTEVLDQAIGDFDDDGNLDLFLCAEDQPYLFLNERKNEFRNASGGFRLKDRGRVEKSLVADVNRDGLFDVVLVSKAGGRLLVNTMGNGFERFPLPGEAHRQPWLSALLFDPDNDGDLDLLASVDNGDASLLFYRQREGIFAEESLDLAAPPLHSLAALDLDQDGDLDVFGAGRDQKLHYWRNDGGDRNQWLRVRLRGKNDNNSKNNANGYLTRIELRTGDRYQAALGNGGINHFGLAEHRQADVMRVVWTNGVPQSWVNVAANRVLHEEQVLKGSCPFLYTWTGSQFEFCTDLLWNSPLGMVLADGSAAPHQSGRDFVRIDGTRAQAAGDLLPFQITGELWEACYFDEITLYALDHDEDLELWVDETFSRPPYPTEPKIIAVRNWIPPVKAVDDQERSWLAEIQKQDGNYVDGLAVTKYQGVTKPHHLELHFENLPKQQPLQLFLWGWIFPTDSSINFALSQHSRLGTSLPRLEQRNKQGDFEVIQDVIGLPKGKRKCVITRVPEWNSEQPLALRIVTDMQIYWDRAALAVAEPGLRNPVALPLTFADLHPRGYSREYRNSESGPHLFDYSDTRYGNRWRPMTGRYTRSGDVLELLEHTDDMLAVIAAGDEITLTFSLAGLPPLEKHQRRDYVLYCDGWVKDADPNTAKSMTVEPYPYHGMSSYPDTPAHEFPHSQRHLDYLAEYQTREVTDEAFLNELKGGPHRWFQSPASVRWRQPPEQ